MSLHQKEARKQKGIEYKGYIAIVRDLAGQIIAIKSSRPEFEKNIDALLGTQKGDIFDREFEPNETKKVTNRIK